jgi:hypothetical protein
MIEPNSGNRNPHLELLKAILFTGNEPILILTFKDWVKKPNRPRIDRRLLSKRETRKWISTWIENFLTIEAYEKCAKLHKTKP